MHVNITDRMLCFAGLISVVLVSAGCTGKNEAGATGDSVLPQEVRVYRSLDKALQEP